MLIFVCIFFTYFGSGPNKSLILTDPVPKNWLAFLTIAELSDMNFYGKYWTGVEKQLCILKKMKSWAVHMPVVATAFLAA